MHKKHVHLCIYDVMNCTCLTKLNYISSRCRILHKQCSFLSYLMCNTISRRGGIICGPSEKINRRGKMIGHRGGIIISPFDAYWRTEVIINEIEYFILACDVAMKLVYDECLICMMTSSNGNILRVTGHLSGEPTVHRWIPHTKASDTQL